MAFPSIPFAKPNIGPQEEEAVLRVLRSGWLTTGQEALAFEKEFAIAAGTPWALAVNSATSGLHLALEALGIGPGDHVALPPYTFTASAEILRYLGAHPWFVDVAPGTFHLDPAALEATLAQAGKGTVPPIKAVMPVHIGGVAWELDRIYEVCAAHGVPVVEDAAHAFPARLAPNAPQRAEALAPTAPLLGTGGELGIFSFYANKTITTAEGGMVTGTSEAQARRMKVMRSHGIDREVWQRFSGQAQQWRYAVVAPGFKYNLPDLNAALGRAQLARADELMEARRLIARRYLEAFRGLSWLRLPPHAEWAATEPLGHSWHIFTVQLQDGPRGNPRDRWIGELQDQGIGTSVHYIPLHTMPYYRDTYRLAPEDFPQAQESFKGALSLPLWAGLSDHDADRVIEAVLRLGREEYGK